MKKTMRPIYNLREAPARMKPVCLAALSLCCLLAVEAVHAQQRDTNGKPAIAVTVPAVTGTFTSFDVPGAGTGAHQGTFPFAITAGVITGYYSDANSLNHGFLRNSSGTLTSFDVPDGVNGTFALAINPAGVVTGYYNDANSVAHGFLRASSGAFATFDAPQEVNGTYPSGVNSAGSIAGIYYDANKVSHGFLRTPSGKFTTFEAPGAGTIAPAGTFAAGIDTSGTVSGCYIDANSVNHGFVRSSEGALTTFDVPGGQSTGCYNYLFPARGTGINLNGAVTGAFFEPIGGQPIWHGFLRFPDGTFATFDAADNTSCCIWTFGIAINKAGTITGYENDGLNTNHGFVRPKEGTSTLLDAPGAGTGFQQGTIADGIDSSGRITGWYVDANNITHGFLWTP
jgi:hypothetical protein